MEEPCSSTSTGKPSRHLRAWWESPPHTKEEGFGGSNLFLCTVEVEARDFMHLGQVTSLGKTLSESEFIFLLSCSFWALHRRTLLHSVTISEELTVVWVVHGTSPAGTPFIIPYEKRAPCSCSVHTLDGCTRCLHPFGGPTLVPWTELHMGSPQAAGVVSGATLGV